MLCPSNFPGLEIPIVDSTMQGGRNSISMGYGSQYPCRLDAGVKNFTKLRIKRTRIRYCVALQSSFGLCDIISFTYLCQTLDLKMK